MMLGSIEVMAKAVKDYRKLREKPEKSLQYQERKALDELIKKIEGFDQGWTPANGQVLALGTTLGLVLCEGMVEPVDIEIDGGRPMPFVDPRARQYGLTCQASCSFRSRDCQPWWWAAQQWGWAIVQMTPPTRPTTNLGRPKDQTA